MPAPESPAALAAEAGAHVPIHRLVQAAAGRFAGAAAIEQGEHRITHGELERRAGAVAAALAAAGTARGDLVAILAEASADVIASALGVLRAGGAFVPLDPRSPATRLEDAVAAARPRVCLVAAEHAPVLQRIERAAGVALLSVRLDEVGPAGAGEEPQIELGPDDLAYVCFTSGSTGRPKAIAGRLSAIDHFIRWEIDAFGLGPGVRVSQLTSPAFDAFLRDAFVPLAAGGTVCAPPARDLVAEGDRLAAWIEGSGLHLLHCTPSLFRLLLAQEPVPERFPALRHVLLAGEPLPPADVRRWQAVFGQRIELVNLYGPSETTMVKLFHRVRPADAAEALVPIGKPMPGARALVLDGRQRPCPPGKLGEICIRTPYRALGYLDQPELTRQAFVPNPLGADAGDVIYRTGDLGRVREDGNLEVIGRRDQQVKVRGVRVELAPIEALLRSQEGIADAAVVDRLDGEGNTFLCAYLVLAGELDAERLGEVLRGQLPAADYDEVFPPRPSSRCGWCDYQRSCPEGQQAAAPHRPWDALAEL